MQAVIEAGNGPISFKGKLYYTVESLPTQAEIDAAYDDTTTVVGAVETLTDRFPANLDADGGLKVHLQNADDIAGGGGGVGLTDAELRAAPVDVEAGIPALVDGGIPVTLLNPEDIASGGGGGGGLTDTELRAAPVPVSGFPAVQPVSDNGGSLTVDGPLTDAQLRNSAVPVSISNFPATQPVSEADGANLALGATTDAEATGNGSSIGVLKRLRTLAGNIITLLGAGLPGALGGSGGVKVDVLSGAGGASMGAEVTALALASRSTGFNTSDITNTGYRGIILHFAFTAGTFSGSATNWMIEEKNPVDGTYSTLASTNTPANNTAFRGKIVVYPGIVEVAASASARSVSTPLPRTFRITLTNLGSQTMTTGASYTLIP
jgi:hypothetical protein